MNVHAKRRGCHGTKVAGASDAARRDGRRVAFDEKLGALDPGCRTVADTELPIVGDPRTRRLDGIHVVVVDDDGSSRRTLQRALETWGALVSVATADDALRTALRADVIVVDLGTAEAAGREFLSHLHRLHSRPNRLVPIIGLAPLGMETPATPRAAGVQFYFVKPVEADELRSAVWQLARE